LLRQPSTLSRAERELIATYVSAENDCYFCQTVHGAVAAHHLGGDEDLVLKTKTNPATAPVSAKLKALLKIAGIVQKGGKSVLAEDIEQARQLGATDLEIHDTDNPDMYRAQGARLAREGYVNSTKGVAAGSHA
jgi:uncharacterized peroxidase-related enzyme